MKDLLTKKQADEIKDDAQRLAYCIDEMNYDADNVDFMIFLAENIKLILESAKNENQP